MRLQHVPLSELAKTTLKGIGATGADPAPSGDFRKGQLSARCARSRQSGAGPLAGQTGHSAGVITTALAYQEEKTSRTMIDRAYAQAIFRLGRFTWGTSVAGGGRQDH